MTDVDMDYLLLDLTRDTKSFEILLRGQIAYTAVVLDQAVANGSRHLPSVVVTPGRVFGHILEARSQATEGEKARLAEELARVQSYVGLFTSLAVQKAQAAVASRAPVAGEAANLLVPQTQQALEKMIAKRLTEKPNKAILTTGTNTEAVEKLFSQMIASALITHGRYDRQDLKGKNFATTGDSPEILPLEKLDSHQLEALLSWASENSDIEDLGGRAVTEMDTGKKATAGHYTDSQGNQANPLLEK
ncbi:hypothetical protein [Spirillospora sp. NPDC047279]|uniref:hypothetical protein n=1 Tax=Spirillospora sp. NPDC047279 TaxID=3155478 RepID=UPI003402A8F7